jgi:hypothetical protein
MWTFINDVVSWTPHQSSANPWWKNRKEKIANLEQLRILKEGLSYVGLIYYSADYTVMIDDHTAHLPPIMIRVPP